jgi:hypothetical protein
MPYPRKAQPTRHATSTRLTTQPTRPISPQAATDTMMALYSDARRQLDAVELFLSSLEDKVQCRIDIAYGAWLGAEWRIQLATLAGTLRIKIEKVYLPTLSAVALHPECSPETRAALRQLEHRSHGVLNDLIELDVTLTGVALAGASTRTEMAALGAAELTCRGVVFEAEEAMYALNPDRAAEWMEICKMRSATMVPYSSRYQ